MESARRFYLLDALRGIAALSVVVWHWQHFYPQGAMPFHRAEQPYFWLLLPLYREGPRAVDLFFCLSGFVFHWLYGQDIARRAISGREFFLRRFSRLYPLHFATLIFVAAAFLAFGPHIYQSDAYHFGLNVLLASSIGFEKGYSFNGPSWSVSVEMLLYAVFFVACRWLPSRLLTCALGIAAGLALWNVHEPVARGLVSFFAGGLVYLAFARMPRLGGAVLLRVVALLWLATLAQMYAGFFETPSWVASAWTLGVLFPSSVLALALAETPGRRAAMPVAFLGDISYSVYLLHFPLQLVAIDLHLPMQNAAAMPAFFIVLLVAAAASRRYLERPAQSWLRGALTSEDSAAAARSAARAGG